MAKKRIVYYDVLNILACISVVCLHANIPAYNYEPGRSWMVAEAMNAPLMFCVPIFFMISGATLMRYRSRYSTGEFLKKRLGRTVVPLVIWSAVFFAISVVLDAPNVLGGPVTVESVLRSFVDRFLFLKIEPIYWFFFPLFGMYLLMPALSLLADDRKVLWYLVGVVAVFSWTLPALWQVLVPARNYPFTLEYLADGLPYIGYTLLGYLLATGELSKRNRRLLYVAGVVGIAGSLAITLAKSAAVGANFSVMMTFPTIGIAAYSAAVFVFGKRHLDSLPGALGKPGAIKAISAVSACSFGVYLIHDFLILHTGLLPLLDLTGYETWWRIGGGLLAYAISLTIVFVVKKVPGLRVVFP